MSSTRICLWFYAIFFCCGFFFKIHKFLVYTFCRFQKTVDTYTRYVWKVLKLKLSFPKTEGNNEWNVHFLQNDSLGIKHTYSSEFSTGWSTTEVPLFIWCDSVPFLLTSSASSNPLKWILCLGIKRKLNGMRSGEYGNCCTCTALCFTKYCLSKSIVNWHCLI